MRLSAIVLLVAGLSAAELQAQVSVATPRPSGRVGARAFSLPRGGVGRGLGGFGGGLGGGLGFGGFGGGFVGGLGGGYSGAFGLDPYASGRIPTPPYYSLHPPVYYGQVVHRAYGRTPYATPTFNLGVAMAPMMVANPHVSSAAVATLDRATGEVSQVVTNPYVGQGAVVDPALIVNPYVTSPQQQVARN